MKKSLLTSAALAALAFSGNAYGQATATPGQEVSMVLLPKFLGIAVFDQAHEGALEAQKELQNPTELQFLWANARKQRGRPDRNRHQRHDPGRRRDHDFQQFGRPDRARGQSRSRQRAQGGDLGFPDPVGRGRR